MKQQVLFGVKCIVGGFVGMVLTWMLYGLALDLTYLHLSRLADVRRGQLLELQRLQQDAQREQAAHIHPPVQPEK